MFHCLTNIVVQVRFEFWGSRRENARQSLAWYWYTLVISTCTPLWILPHLTRWKQKKFSHRGTQSGWSWHRVWKNRECECLPVASTSYFFLPQSQQIEFFILFNFNFRLFRLNVGADVYQYVRVRTQFLFHSLVLLRVGRVCTCWECYVLRSMSIVRVVRYTNTRTGIPPEYQRWCAGNVWPRRRDKHQTPVPVRGTYTSPCTGTTRGQRQQTRMFFFTLRVLLQ